LAKTSEAIPFRPPTSGECVELGTATHGANLQQTLHELKELVLLHLNEIEDVGERPRFFAEHGIKLYPAQPRMVQLKLHH